MNLKNKLIVRVGYFQSLVYIITGVWPILDIHTFTMVTGPKVDIWLVKTVGLFITATGLVMFSALRRNEFNYSIILLAFLNALFLTAIDTYYALTNVISNIYLLDAAMETVFWLFWGYVLLALRRNQ